MGPGHQLFKVSQEAISASLLFLAGIFEFGEGLLHARNAHGEGGWLKELSVPRVGTVGYFCSASLGYTNPPTYDPKSDILKKSLMKKFCYYNSPAND
ncbi:hypothetical protein AL050_27835 [Pseudomonas syringae pv. daphniphylli]|nr:hypothetical protein AL050_27835 [Pseudomonas syringae pv. daphniphylli]